MTTGEPVGWIGAGRMGSELIKRLLDSGTEVWVYNRTRAKAEALAEHGAKVVDSPADLATLDIIFTMVGGPGDVMEVTVGENGVLSRDDARPSIIVDSTTIDPATSKELRAAAAERGVDVLAAPVSGNPKVVKSGKLTVVASGPEAAYKRAEPHLESFGHKVTYVGSEDEARLVKICHNLMLGIVAQSMAEISVLAEASGVARADLLDFLNDSVMGSMFTQYKTPAFVNLDYTPTFTWHLLRKDFELGLSTARELDIPVPTAALVHQIIIEGIGLGYGDEDFAAMLTKAARASGREVAPENREVSDGLS
ncbi:MAG TPA: NAD(P)-dependent oxidoreductase [Acidimicrobiia bacterium]|nr:NAD(P)-dependent oxidoreductase [Acidimicrobiia bacterium]